MTRDDGPEETPRNGDLFVRIQRGIAKLQSMHDGDIAVVELAACGKGAIPVLRDFVFRREPSGLYQARCRAVETLAALGAFDVLRDLLGLPLDRPDPVERMGDEAVVNAAARTSIGSHDEEVFYLLLDLARHRHLMGVIEALGTFQKTEAIPRLIDALAEDCSRPAAETALLRLGPRARAMLLLQAATRRPSDDNESVSELRQRRSALRLLLILGAPQGAWTEIRHLSGNPDIEIAVLTNELALASAPIEERHNAVDNLIALLPKADWRMETEIETALIEHPEMVNKVIEDLSERSANIKQRQALRRIKERVRSALSRY
jgi:HEAT repeat protein